jgi:hypothetical protein
MIRKTAPPTTQTQGWVYHSVVVVVVVSLVTVISVLELPVLSCAKAINWAMANRNNNTIFWAKAVIDCFMLVIFDNKIGMLINLNFLNKELGQMKTC